MPRRLDRRRAPRGPVRRRARRPAGPARQQQVRRRAGRGAGRRGGPHRRRLLRRDRPARAAGRRAGSTAGPRPPSRPGPGHPGRRGPHPRVRPHRPGGLEVRLRPGLGGRRRGRGPRCAARCRGRSSSSGSTPTSGARSSRWPPSTQAVEVLAGFFAPLGLPELCVGGGLGVAYVERRGGAARSPSGPTTVRTACARARASRPTVRITAEPGRSIVAAAGDHALPGRHDQGRSPASGPTSRRRRDERQPPPGALRQRLRGVPAPGRRRARARRRSRVVGKHCESGDVVVPRRAACPPTSPSATSWPPRSPAPTATPWPRTTTRCRRPPSSSSPTARARVVVRRETFDDLIRLDA